MSAPAQVFKTFAANELATAKAQARSATNNQLQNLELPSRASLQIKMRKAVRDQSFQIADGLPGIPSNVRAELANLVGLSQVSQTAGQLVSEYAGPLGIALSVGHQFLTAVFSVTGSNADNFLYWRGRRSLPDQYLTYKLFDQLKGAGFSVSQARQINAAAKPRLRPVLEVIGASVGKQAQNAMRKWYSDTPIYQWWGNEEEADRLIRIMENRFRQQAQPFLDLTVAAALRAVTPTQQTTQQSTRGGNMIGFPKGRFGASATDFRPEGFNALSFDLLFRVPQGTQFNISQTPSALPKNRVMGRDWKPVITSNGTHVNILVGFGARSYGSGPLQRHNKRIKLNLTPQQARDIRRGIGIQVNVFADVNAQDDPRWVGSGRLVMPARAQQTASTPPRQEQTQWRPSFGGIGGSTDRQGNQQKAAPMMGASFPPWIIPAAGALAALKLFKVV